MDPTFYGIPFGISRLFGRDSNLKDYYFSLPDEAQQAILKEDIQTQKDFYDCVEKLKLKE